MGLEPTDSWLTTRPLDHFGIGHRIGGRSRTPYHRVCSPAPHHGELGAADLSYLPNCQRTNKKTHPGMTWVGMRVFRVTGPGLSNLSRVLGYAYGSGCMGVLSP